MRALSQCKHLVQSVVSSTVPILQEVTSSPLSPVKSDPLVIVDASFNPPTRAHIAMLQQARRFCSEQPHAQCDALLLLSTKNAEKDAASLESMAHRVMMLTRLAEEEEVHVLLTNQALFVEKAKLLREMFAFQNMWMVMGVDTLIRVWDIHYYNSSVEQRDQCLDTLFRALGSNGGLLVMSRATIPSDDFCIQNILDERPNHVKLMEHDEAHLMTCSSSLARKRLRDHQRPRQPVGTRDIRSRLQAVFEGVRRKADGLTGSANRVRK